LGGEEGHGASLVALGRDRQHALNDGGVLWVVESGVAKQRSDRGQAQVARPCAVAAVTLEVIEERRDHRLVELAPSQRRWRAAGGVLDEAQQQAQRVAISATC